MRRPRSRGRRERRGAADPGDEDPGDERARNRPDPLSLGSALRGAALALLPCRERHDGSPAEARDSSVSRQNTHVCEISGRGRREGRRGVEVSSKLIRGPLTTRACRPSLKNGLLGWKDMPPAAQHRGHKPPLGARRVIEGERGTEGREGDRRGLIERGWEVSKSAGDAALWNADDLDDDF